MRSRESGYVFGSYSHLLDADVDAGLRVEGGVRLSSLFFASFSRVLDDQVIFWTI